ncbi:MAG: RluA family pseudouridine synthase [Phycisphaeraceae bacterium]
MRKSEPDKSARLIVGQRDAGGRLDRVVARWRGVSRAGVCRLLDAGGVRLNGRLVTRRDKGIELRAGDTLELLEGYDAEEAPRPDAALPLDILAQGAGWLVVNKPAGVPVRPRALDEVGTVINAVAARRPQVVGVGEGGLRSGVVHRLDNDTSGTLIVATQQAQWQRLRRAFADHRVAKRYAALVHADPPDTGESIQHLRVGRHRPAHVQVVSHRADRAGSRPCSLAWRVIERLTHGVCHIEVDLHTGFLHQVRVMMSHHGHPLLGDTQYGKGKPRHGATRQMLHAQSIAFEDVAARAPLPADFGAVLEALRSL